MPLRAKATSPIFLVASLPKLKLMVWAFLVTVNVRAMAGADAYFSLPAWAAVIVAVPAPTTTAKLPETITTDELLLLKLTAKINLAFVGHHRRPLLYLQRGNKGVSLRRA